MGQDFDDRLKVLVEAWCDRREYTPLRVILQAYPRITGLTDEWADLAKALKTIRFECPRRLTPDELIEVADLQKQAEWVLKRPRW